MSANENLIKLFGAYSTNKDTRGGAQTIPSAVIGIVKNNIDPTRSGRVEVYLVRGNSSDQDNPASWVPVNYMSPFFGYTTNGASTSDDGKYLGNPNSYGMWMTPPDVGTQVLCVFLNGDPNFGYYIGSLPLPGLTFMVPAVGASDYLLANSSEAQSYGGAKRLPVTEYNNANKKLDDSPGVVYSPRPVHSYQAAILFKQGLIKDTDRGTIGSSSMRESPSKVFGISTPGRPIYKGGYTDDTIAGAIKSNAPDDSFQITGRRGGHSFVMDDGDVTGKDQLIRLRTATGHMIMMNDYAQTLIIMHANGQSYIELGREGTIDMYSTNSVNIRTEGDLNLHADRNININAVGDLSMSAKNLKMESLKDTTQYAGAKYNAYAKGDYTIKGESNYAVDVAGDLGLKSSGTVFLNGGKNKPNIKINSGTISVTPPKVSQHKVNALSDTLYDSTKGYNSAPAYMSSIVNRAPAHMPWDMAGKGVDVSTNKSSSAAFAALPSSQIQALNSAVGTASAVTNPNLMATVPDLSAAANASSTLDKGAMTGLVSQMAVAAQNGPAGAAIASVGGAGAGVLSNGTTSTAVVGAFAMSPNQLEDAGVIKPGSATAVNASVAKGASVQNAMPDNIFTGQNGTNSLNQFLNNTPAQAAGAANLLNKSESSLISSGILSGNEHSTQTSGLILSTAMAGLGPTANFLSSTGSVPGVSALTGQGLSTSVANQLNGSPADLIAGGNAAGALADKAMSTLSGVPLGGIDVTAALKGFASGLFSTVLSAFKSFTPNVPQNLSTISSASGASSLASGANLGALAGAAGQVASQAASAGVQAALASNPELSAGLAIANQVSSGKPITAQSLAGAAISSEVPGVNPTALGGVPSGAVALDTSSIPSSAGTQNISGAISSLAGAAGTSSLGTSIASAQSALGGSSLSDIAGAGLAPSQLSSLNALFSTIGGGALNISLPSIKTNSFDTSGMASTTKGLTVPGVPPLSFGTKNTAPATTSSDIISLNQQIDAAEAECKKLFAAYETTKAQYGYESAQAKEALHQYSVGVQKAEDLEEKLSKTKAV